MEPITYYFTDDLHTCYVRSLVSVLCLWTYTIFILFLCVFCCQPSISRIHSIALRRLERERQDELVCARHSIGISVVLVSVQEGILFIPMQWWDWQSSNKQGLTNIIQTNKSEFYVYPLIAWLLVFFVESFRIQFYRLTINLEY